MDAFVCLFVFVCLFCKIRFTYECEMSYTSANLDWFCYQGYLPFTFTHLLGMIIVINLGHSHSLLFIYLFIYFSFDLFNLFIYLLFIYLFIYLFIVLLFKNKMLLLAISVLVRNHFTNATCRGAWCKKGP